MKIFGNSREAGMLMPLSSLPGDYGIGDMGQCAYDFIDLLEESGFKIWQILPLNPVGYGNSPYQPYSSFAGDEIYIDIKGNPNLFPPSEYIHYEDVRAYKSLCLKESYASFQKDKEYEAFIKHAFWLDDYARFMSLKNVNNGMWMEWTNHTYLQEDYDYICFVQYLFYKQWMKLKSYANSKGITIIGDIPIYVGIDSADVYSHKEYFDLDDMYYPVHVAGVPPDYFNSEGQLWGNPIYNWKEMKKDGYQFWIDRLKWNKELYDGIRIDHFRAFDTYWSIPSFSRTAKEGHWELGPSYDLFDKIYEIFPDIQLIAEDLGDLRPEVLELRDHYHLLGMRIVQYAFGKEDKENGYQLPEYCIAYPGTHDNSPIKGWYHLLALKEKIRIRLILRQYKGKDINDKMLRHTLSQPCVLAIIPMQDVLKLDETTRINRPGTVGTPNWCWKLRSLRQFEKQVPEIKKLLKETNRV